MSSILKNTPAVFSVGDNYKIFIQTSESALMWIKVGEECYFDHSNGVIRSGTNMHKITLPAEALDKEKRYTVCYRRVIERKPYFSQTGDVEEISFEFSPLPDEKFNVFQVADAHGMINQPVAAAKVFENEFGKIDLLVLNGDVIDHSGRIENFDAIYEITSLITKGRIPTVFSRGNHDTRGIYAENIADYTPTLDGNSYFSFRVSGLWGLVLDCGEDKADSHAEYGNTICCHSFRREETRYLENIIKNAKSEYEADGVKRKIILAHSPFTTRFNEPFNIEEDTYEYWTKLIKENIKPDVMLCGHTHKFDINRPGDEKDVYGIGWPVVVASRPSIKERRFAGGGLVFDGDSITAVFCDEEKIISKEAL